MVTNIESITEEVIDEATEGGELHSIDPATIAALLAILGPIIQRFIEQISERCDDSLQNVASRHRGRRWANRRRVRQVETAVHNYCEENDCNLFDSRFECRAACEEFVDSMFDVASRTTDKASDLLPKLTK